MTIFRRSDVMLEIMKMTSGVDKDRKLKDVYGNNYKVPLDHLTNIQLGYEVIQSGTR